MENDCVLDQVRNEILLVIQMHVTALSVSRYSILILCLPINQDVFITPPQISLNIHIAYLLAYVYKWPELVL
jgi:hypothetical protein